MPLIPIVFVLTAVGAALWVTAPLARPFSRRRSIAWSAESVNGRGGGGQHLWRGNSHGGLPQRGGTL